MIIMMIFNMSKGLSQIWLQTGKSQTPGQGETQTQQKA
jgi:hypothetical protein